MSRCNCETPKTRADGNRRKCLLCGKLIPLKPKNVIVRWCNCEEPKPKSVESRKCLLCGKLLRLKGKAPQIPNWKITKDPEFNNCLRINFGKRTMIYNPNLYWVRYAGTKKAPVIYAYNTAPIKEIPSPERLPRTCGKKCPPNLDDCGNFRFANGLLLGIQCPYRFGTMNAQRALNARESRGEIY